MKRYAVGALAPSRGKGSKGIVVTATRIPISFCVEFLTRRQPGKILFVSVSPFLMTDFDLVCLVFLSLLVYKIYKGDLLLAIL